MFKNTIGEKRAKQIATFVVEEAKKQNLIMPYTVRFIEEGAVVGVLLEMAQEMKTIMNKITIDYQMRSHFREYVDSFLPNKIQAEMFKHYGEETIKRMKSFY